MSGNACYHSVQNLLSSSLLSKNTQIKIHRTVTLPFVLYGCETRSLTLRKEHRTGGSRIGCWWRHLALKGKKDKEMEKTTQRRALCSALLTKWYSAHKIEKNEMGGASGTNGEDEW